MVAPAIRTIHFDEPSHRYTDNYGKVYTSVTQLIGKYTPVFDKRYWLFYKGLQGLGFKVRPSVETQEIWLGANKYHINAIVKFKPELKAIIDDLEKQWIRIAADACDKGNKVHNKLEDSINAANGGMKLNFGHTTIKGQLGLGNLISLDILKRTPLALNYPKIYSTICKYVEADYLIYAENIIYSAEYGISGKIDCILVKGTSFVILDWKTNKDELKFKAGYYKKKDGFVTTEWVDKPEDVYHTPINNLQHCKGITYTLQLSLYAYLLELWGYTCKGLILAHIRNDVKLHVLSYLKDDVHKLVTYNLKPLTHTNNVTKSKISFDKAINF
jgi:hypothetical protein